MLFRRMCECIAGSANPVAELQVRAVLSALPVAWGRHRTGRELLARCAPTRRSGEARVTTGCEQSGEVSSSRDRQLGTFTESLLSALWKRSSESVPGVPKP